MEIYAQRQGGAATAYRFIFRGNWFPGTQTPDDLDMKDEDIIDAMIDQVGDIGQWGAHPGSVGVEFLRGKTASLSEARALIEGFGGKCAPVVSMPRAVAIDARGRTALVRRAQQHHSTTPGLHDLKVALSLADLQADIGSAAVDGLLEVFGGRVDSIKIRRVDATGGATHVINFHTDVSQKTMQIPLNSEEEYEGGRVIYATREGMRMQPRQPGSVTVHDNRVVHGVTQLLSGVRYSLFFLQRVPSITLSASALCLLS